MNRTKRIGRLGGLAVPAAAAALFAYLWVPMMNSADDPLTTRARLDMAIWVGGIRRALDHRSLAAVAGLVAAGR